MNKTNIEWCDYTWNPVVGCKRGCKYCYARTMYNRFAGHLYDGKPYSDIQYLPARVDQPEHHKNPATIFIGSMSDSEYWENDAFVGQIFETIARCPRHTFMFLSKSPIFYFKHRFPKNTMQGLTVTSYYHPNDLMNVAAMSTLPQPYLSLEPILGPVAFDIPKQIKMVIVGAQSKQPGVDTVEPLSEWMYGIRAHVPAKKVFLKESIKPYWNNCHIQIDMFGGDT